MGTGFSHILISAREVPSVLRAARLPLRNLRVVAVGGVVDETGNRARAHRGAGHPEQNGRHEQTPNAVYARSERAYPARVPEPEYGSAFQVRRVQEHGQFRWKSENVFLSGTLTGESIGLLAEVPRPINPKSHKNKKCQGCARSKMSTMSSTVHSQRPLPAYFVGASRSASLLSSFRGSELSSDIKMQHEVPTSALHHPQPAFVSS